MSYPERSTLYINLPENMFHEVTDRMRKQAPDDDLTKLVSSSPQVAYDALAEVLAEVSMLGHKFNPDEPADDSQRHALLPPITSSPTEVRLGIVYTADDNPRVMHKAASAVVVALTMNVFPSIKSV
jgi:hypothetical protein